MTTREIAQSGAGIGGTAKGAVPSRKPSTRRRRSTARADARNGEGYGPAPEPMTRRRLDYKRRAKRGRPDHRYAGMGRGGLHWEAAIEAAGGVTDMPVDFLPHHVHLSHRRTRADGGEHLCQILAMDGRLLAAGHAPDRGQARLRACQELQTMLGDGVTLRTTSRRRGRAIRRTYGPGTLESPDRQRSGQRRPHRQ